MVEEFLTPRQVGREIGVSDQTVRNLIRAGRMEAIRVNAGEQNCFRIRRSEVNRWLAERTMCRR